MLAVSGRGGARLGVSLRGGGMLGAFGGGGMLGEAASVLAAGFTVGNLGGVLGRAVSVVTAPLGAFGGAA